MNKKPVIGLTSTRYLVSGDKMTGMPRTMLNEDYTKAIQKAGGIAVILPPICSKDEIKEYSKICDGLLATGGWDVSPLTYGQPHNKKCEKTDYEVDKTHIAIINEMLNVDKPVLGICRGMQLMNVVQGGTLYQDIYTEVPFNVQGHNFTNLRWDPIHKIGIEENTLLHDIFKKNTIFVNSIHHQAIKDLGRDVKVCSKAEDEIIEAIVIEGKKFALGTQWHPEMLLNASDEMMDLFLAFISAC